MVCITILQSLQEKRKKNYNAWGPLRGRTSGGLKLGINTTSPSKIVFFFFFNVSNFPKFSNVSNFPKFSKIFARYVK